MVCNYLIIIQWCAFAPVLRGCAHKCDIIMTWDTVFLPPIQLHHVLTAHLHQPVHQTQGHEPAKHINILVLINIRLRYILIIPRCHLNT